MHLMGVDLMGVYLTGVHLIWAWPFRAKIRMMDSSVLASVSHSDVTHWLLHFLKKAARNAVGAIQVIWYLHLILIKEKVLHI
jgi:hypothetical protein